MEEYLYVGPPKVTAATWSQLLNMLFQGREEGRGAFSREGRRREGWSMVKAGWRESYSKGEKDREEKKRREEKSPSGTHKNTRAHAYLQFSRCLCVGH
jgi:hypothetical protein